MPFTRDKDGNLVYSNSAEYSPKVTQLPNTLGVDLDKYTDYESNDYIKGAYDAQYWNNERAKKQNGFAKFLNSTGQMVGTFGTSLASTVSSLGSGAVALGAEALTGGEAEGMDIFLNNPIMKGISDFDTYLKEDLLPTYYTKDQQESLFSASTGTDLLNGIGFLASNILPNTAVIKSFGGLSKMAALSKAGKLDKMLDVAVKTGKIGNIEKQVLSSTARYLGNAGPIIGAVTGRIGESAIESYQTYQDLIDQGYSEEEAKSQRDNVFMGNMALAVSDLAQYSRWFRGSGIGSKLVQDGLATTVAKEGKKEILGSLLKEASQEAAEEGYQFLLSKGAEKAAKGKSFIDGISESTGELFGTIEGVKSMAIGAVLGGGMSRIAEARNAKKQKAYLQDLANNLTQNADVTERFITTPEGQRIVNPELTKIATRFATYEQLKDQALAAGDQQAYDVLEKTQFSDLVAAKIEAGQYEDFIDQLRDMGNSSEEEIQAMFGDLPIRDGKQLTPKQVAQEKIQLAERVKQMTEGLSILPKLQNVSRSAMSLVRHKLFTQEALREEVKYIDNQIAQIKARAVTTFFPDSQKLVENELLPQDQYQLEQLESRRKDLVNNFIETSTDFKQYVEDPNKAQEEADKIQEKNIKDSIDNEIEKITKEEKQVAQSIENKDTINIDGEDVTIIGEDPETGNPIVQNQSGEQTIVDKTDVIVPEEVNDFEEEAPISTVEERQHELISEDPAKKPTQLSTSGQALLIENNLHVIEEGEKKLNPEFENQTRVFNNPTISNNVVSDPKDTPNVITFKATLEALIENNGTKKADIERRKNEDIDIRLREDPMQFGSWMVTGLAGGFKSKEEAIQAINAKYDAELAALEPSINLEKTNNRRRDNNLEPLTEEDLKSTDYIPIKLTLQINGKDQNITNYFHNPEYYFRTSAANREDVNHQEEFQKQREIRAKLVEQIKANGEAIIKTESKSDGVLNYNPLVQGQRKTSPVLQIFGGVSVEQFISPKSHNLWIIDQEPKQVKTKGLQIVTAVMPSSKEGWFDVTYTNAVGATEIRHLQEAPVLGQMTYEVVTPSGSVRKITPFSKKSFSPEQIDQMAELIHFRLTSGEKTIVANGTEYQIIGNESNPGIIDSLIYTGFVKSKSAEAKASQLGFDKNNNLYLGQDVIDRNDPEALALITNHLRQYKSKPHFKFRSMVFDKFGIPSFDGENWKIESPKKYENFMFSGEDALIQTALSKPIFVNSYFKFATDSNGDILTEIETVESIPAIIEQSDLPSEVQEKEAECNGSTNGKPNDLIGLDDWEIEEI